MGWKPSAPGRDGVPVRSVLAIRFPRFGVEEVLTYYFLNSVPSLLEKAAMVICLDIDEFLPAENQRNRYIGNPQAALLVGDDAPGAYVQAQLTMLDKVNLRSD